MSQSLQNGTVQYVLCRCEVIDVLLQSVGRVKKETTGFLQRQRNVERGLLTVLPVLSQEIERDWYYIPKRSKAK